jgi:hypothetical protein
MKPLRAASTARMDNGVVALRILIVAAALLCWCTSIEADAGAPAGKSVTAPSIGPQMYSPQPSMRSPVAPPKLGGTPSGGTNSPVGVQVRPSGPPTGATAAKISPRPHPAVTRYLQNKVDTYQKSIQRVQVQISRQQQLNQKDPATLKKLQPAPKKNQAAITQLKNDIHVRNTAVLNLQATQKSYQSIAAEFKSSLQKRQAAVKEIRSSLQQYGAIPGVQASPQTTSGPVQAPTFPAVAPKVVASGTSGTATAVPPLTWGTTSTTTAKPKGSGVLGGAAGLGSTSAPSGSTGSGAGSTGSSGGSGSGSLAAAQPTSYLGTVGIGLTIFRWKTGKI